MLVYKNEGQGPSPGCLKKKPEIGLWKEIHPYGKKKCLNNCKHFGIKWATLMMKASPRFSGDLTFLLTPSPVPLPCGLPPTPKHLQGLQIRQKVKPDQLLTGGVQCGGGGVRHQAGKRGEGKGRRQGHWWKDTRAHTHVHAHVHTYTCAHAHAQGL